MHEPHKSESAPEGHTLADFFAATNRPAQERSNFTPQDVAAIVRQDREGSG